MISRFLPVLALIIAIGLFFGYINPTRTGSIAGAKAQIASYESALAAAERFKEKENELIIARANIPSDGLARAATFLPDGVDNVQIILDLNTLAARSGVTLSDFDTNLRADGTAGEPGLSLESGGPIDSLDITVSATGTYGGFRSFVDGIEASLRLLDVVSVSVEDSATGVYTYDLVLRLYWLR
jgi:hypothetical protein